MKLEMYLRVLEAVAQQLNAFPLVKSDIEGNVAKLRRVSNVNTLHDIRREENWKKTDECAYTWVWWSALTVRSRHCGVA